MAHSLRKHERQDAIEQTCAAYRRLVAEGRANREALDELAKIHGVGTRAINLRLRRGGALPPYRTNTGIKRNRRLGLEKIEAAEARRKVKAA
jgi:hypothetical protein